MEPRPLSGQAVFKCGRVVSDIGVGCAQRAAEALPISDLALSRQFQPFALLERAIGAQAQRTPGTVPLRESGQGGQGGESEYNSRSDPALAPLTPGDPGGRGVVGSTASERPRSQVA